MEKNNHFEQSEPINETRPLQRNEWLRKFSHLFSLIQLKKDGFSLLDDVTEEQIQSTERLKTEDNIEKNIVDIDKEQDYKFWESLIKEEDVPLNNEQILALILYYSNNRYILIDSLARFRILSDNHLDIIKNFVNSNKYKEIIRIQNIRREFEKKVILSQAQSLIKHDLIKVEKRPIEIINARLAMKLWFKKYWGLFQSDEIKKLYDEVKKRKLERLMFPINPKYEIVEEIIKNNGIFLSMEQLKALICHPLQHDFSRLLAKYRILSPNFLAELIKTVPFHKEEITKFQNEKILLEKKEKEHLIYQNDLTREKFNEIYKRIIINNETPVNNQEDDILQTFQYFKTNRLIQDEWYRRKWYSDEEIIIFIKKTLGIENNHQLSLQYFSKTRQDKNIADEVLFHSIVKFLL